MSRFQHDQSDGEGTYGAPVQCREPLLNRLLTAYCFGDANEQEGRSIEAHLLDCDVCWEEVRRLTSAVEALRASRETVGRVSIQEMCSIFGISASLDRPVAGHLSYAILASSLYALTYVFGLISEVSYAFDRLGHAAIWLSLPIFLWIAGTTMAAMALDWKLILQNRSSSLWTSISIIVISSAVLFAGLCFYLPDVSITLMDIPSQTARGAYLKGIAYVLPLAFFFFLVPFHFVMATQRELQAGRNGPALALLTGDKRAVAPVGAVYVGLRTLWILLVVAFLLSVPLTAGLFGHLKPSPYLGVFTLFIYLRWFAYFGLGLTCLLWYSRALDDLNRECLAAGQVRF